MTNKRYAKMKQFISENYKFMLFLVFCWFFFLFPLPYMIDMPGGLLPVEDRVMIQDSFDSSGSFNLSYVNETRANPGNYLLSLFHSDWKRIKIDDIKYDHETLKDAEVRSKLLLEQANQNALIVGYTYAKRKINITDPVFHVAYLDEQVKEDINVGDQLVKINGKEITSYDEIVSFVKQSNVGKNIELTLKRENKERNITIPILNLDGEKRLGILLIPIYQITTTPQIKFTKRAKESGSSGGLMTSLEIYNRLTKEDITHGKTIVGTGTIDIDGTVGEIAGIEFKLRGAEKKKADIFFAPTGKNYQEALALKKKHHFKIDVVEVKHFEDAIRYLETLD